MASVSQADSRRMYSWWWDSHISPKNSRWLMENLTDMDAKVKHMIKLIEEDADSFARRAEMYYKKRPELMKLVEEFYRAYRALAERYDHATGALRQAHRTMAEAFPNQVPSVDDSPAGSTASETYPGTPEMPAHIRALFDLDELQKDALGILKINGDFSDESDPGASRISLKRQDGLLGSGEGRAKRSLKFLDAEANEHSMQTNGHDRVSIAEAEISNLKNALAKLETEKEAGLLQYQDCLEILSHLESEVARAQEDSRGLDERASKAEAEVENTKEALNKSKSEREATLLKYQECLNKISNLEKDAEELNHRASEAESTSDSLQNDLEKLVSEKEAALEQYKQCLERITNLEEKLLNLEEEVKRTNERTARAECEVESLKQAVAELTLEKEAVAFQYKKCLETISNLERKISRAEEEALQLHSQIDDGIAKLKDTEEKCVMLVCSNQNLQSELESAVKQMQSQGKELTEKQKELGRLWASIQEECLRFTETETAFQMLQHLHSQSQEELGSLVAELQNRNLILKDMEARSQSLDDEVQKVKEENKSLTELNISSSISIKELQDEILVLRETIKKLEEEVKLREDQRNVLERDIYRLKEELGELNKKHEATLDQVDSVGLDPLCIGESVKVLQDENLQLKQTFETEKSEKAELLEKLAIMQKLQEENARLENSLSDLNVELEGVRGKVKELEQSCHSLLAEKGTLLDQNSALISQLQILTVNLDKSLEKNNNLECSVSDANAELEGLNVKSKSLEASFISLGNEKTSLIAERESLILKLGGARQRLEDLEKGYVEIEDKLSVLEKERDVALCKVEELNVCLDSERQNHGSLLELREAELADMELKISRLEAEGTSMKKEFEEEQDKSMAAQTEIFVMQKCVEDMEEKNLSLVIENEKLLCASTMSERLISVLERSVLEQQREIKSLEEDICVMFAEILYYSSLSIAFDDIISQKNRKIEGLSHNYDELHRGNNDMKVKVRTLEGTLEVIQTENMQLKKSLSKSKDELTLVKSVNDQLTDEFANAKDGLHRKENELMKAGKIIIKLRNEKKELCDVAKMVLDDKEKQILKLQEDSDDHNEEIGCLHEANQKLEVELSKLHDEVQKANFEEERLIGEQKVRREDVEMWMTEAATLFRELQISSVHETLYEGKIRELVEAHRILEEESISKALSREEMKERVETLEKENRELQAQLAAYIPALISLKKCTTALENHTLITTSHKLNTEASEDAPMQAERSQIEGISELEDLHRRIKAIEKGMVEKECRLAANHGAKQFGNSKKPEISESGNEVLTKDIILDQISECASYGVSRIETTEPDPQIVELWETTDQHDSIDLNVGKADSATGVPTDQTEVVKKHKKKYPSSVSLGEKEYSIDKLEISKRSSEPRQEGNKRKILEKLDSDVQKLTNLQITVEDLKKKVVISEKTKKGKDIEFGTVREQLDEAEEAITKLFDANNKLMKSVEDDFVSPPDSASGIVSDHSGSVNRKRLAEQARRGSEKIGRLQLEVQKLQFLLLKLDGEKESKGSSTGIKDRNTRILLRDYLYSSRTTTSSTTSRRKKAPFCACIPQTKGD